MLFMAAWLSERASSSELLPDRYAQSAHMRVYIYMCTLHTYIYIYMFMHACSTLHCVALHYITLHDLCVYIYIETTKRLDVIGWNHVQFALHAEFCGIHFTNTQMSIAEHLG